MAKHPSSLGAEKNEAGPPSFSADCRRSGDFTKMPVHHQGEVWGGLAQMEQRLGNLEPGEWAAAHKQFGRETVRGQLV